MAYLEKGDLPSALICFKNAVQADPKSLTARLALAETLERSGDLRAAEPHFRRALELGGDVNDLVPRIAVLLLDRADNAIIVRDFATRTLDKATADSDLRALVALAHLGLEQSRQAAEQLDRAKEQTAAVRLTRAEIAFSTNRDEAAAEMDAALKSDHVPWWAARAASRVYQANGENTKALQAIKRAYDAMPNHIGVIGEYAELLMVANRKADARPLRDKLHRLASSYYRTLYLDTLFALDEGNTDLAYTAATRVLAAVPNHTPSQIIVANIELERNELFSAEARVNKILHDNPDSIEGYRLRAALELRRNNLPAAAAATEKGLGRVPEDRTLLAMASTVSWARGEKSKSLSQLQKAADQDPPRADLLARLADQLQVDGQRDSAAIALERGIAAAKDARERETVFNTALRLKQFEKAKVLARKEIELRPKEPEPLMWMAAVEGTEGREASALDYTRRALDLRPDYYPALNALAQTAKSQEQKNEYVSRLQKAVDSRSTEPRVYIDMARVLDASNAPPEKIGELLDNGVAAARSDVGLREAAINHWMRMGRKDKALALAQEGEALLSDSGPMLALSAAVQESVGERAQAAKKYSQLAERFPDRLDWNLIHARNLSDDGKKGDAIQVLQRLIQAHPDDPAAYRALARVQLDLRLPKDAQATAETLRDKPKMKAQGLLLLGDVYAGSDRPAEAIKAFSAAAEAGAGELAFQKKVALLDQTGDASSAAKEITKWLAANPKNVAGYAFAARRASQRQDYPGAAKFMEDVVRLDPKNPVALNDLAWAYVMARDSKALDTANKALALAPKHPVILDTLSQAQANAGMKTEAVATLRQALRADARVAAVRVHLAELLAETDGKKEAAELLQTVDIRDLDGETQKRFAALNGKL